jgi:HEAT repeat protein
MMRNTICLALVIIAGAYESTGAPVADDVSRAWTILEQGAANTNASTRAKAVEALGLLVKDNRSRQLAEPKLRDDAPAVRAAAATAIGQIGLTTSAPALKEALRDNEADVVFAATAALLHLGDADAYRVYYAVLTGERKTGQPLLDSQLKMLKDPNALARIGFEQGIGFIPFGGIGLQVFKSFRQDNVSPVRAAAAQRLAADPDPATGRALATATTDEKWLVRASAISALATRGDRSLVPAVVARLADENETVRFNAAAAVVRLAAPRR